MALTNVEVCQRACRLAGVAPIPSLDSAEPDADTTQRVLVEMYETTVQELLARDYWRFATKQSQLAHHAEEPEGRWQDAWEEPSDVVVMHTVTSGGHPIEYDRYSGLVYCDYGENSTLVADYTFRADEGEFGPQFLAAVIYSIAAVIAIAVQERPQQAQFFTEQMEAKLLLASSTEAQAQTNRSLPRGHFTKRRGSFAARLKRP